MEKEAPMFKIDEYVVHMTGGICQIKDITSLAISGADKDRKYYLLVPLANNSSKVYVPVDNDTAMRKICSGDEAKMLIDSVSTIEELNIDNDKLREAKYKEVIKSCNLRELVSVLKNLHTRRVIRLKEGKKTTATDDKYLKIAGDNLCNELAFALGKEKDEVKRMIADRITV